MLYLAEVQKKTTFIGGTKSELKLLACQRNEQSWSAVPNEELVPADDANNLNAGALVLVEISASKQVQRVQEAGRPLVSILQSFSRMQEKFKTQEEEIEQWKQSLTYQSQELNRREMEMESQREQLHHLEADIEKLEKQRHELETTRTEVNRLKEEVEKNRQNLEGAWDHLRGEMRRFEERQSDVQSTAVLDDEKFHKLQELLNRLTTAVPPTEAVREQLNTGFDNVQRQQGMLDQHWQQLSQKQQTAQQKQSEVEQLVQELHQRWQAWHETQTSLEQAQAELRVQQQSLDLKQEYAQMLGLRLQNHDDLYQQLEQLVNPEASGGKVDVEALQNMPLDELQNLVHELQRDLEKLSAFVADQEEELSLQGQTIADLKERMRQASEYDRLTLEAELSDEQESYRMLNETLEGQRKNLRDRQDTFQRHKAILLKRQGYAPEGESGPSIDLSPVLAQMDNQRQQQVEELRVIEEQIEQVRTSVQQTQSMLEGRAQEQTHQQEELKQQEKTVQEQQHQLAELWGQVNLYQEMLQPLQDGVNDFRQRLEGIASVLAQVQETSDYQLQAIAEMRQVFLTLHNVPEMAAS